MHFFVPAAAELFAVVAYLWVAFDRVDIDCQDQVVALMI